MFCKNCGNEISENDKFCKKCGYKLIEESNNNLPLNWYKFYRYFRLPVSIIFGILSCIGLFSNDMDFWPEATFIFAIIFILLILFYIIVLLLFDYKIGYLLNNILIIIEIVLYSINCTLGIQNSLNTVNNVLIYMLTYILIFGVIWGIPNYIYFKKRKYLFSK